MAATCSLVNPAGMANASAKRFLGAKVNPSIQAPKFMRASIRRAAVAGSWYPGTAPELAAAVDRQLASVDAGPPGDLVALVAPHAGLVYSGPVAAHAYGLLRSRRFAVIVIVGPSHFVGFDGVAAYAPVGSGGFE